MVATFFEKICKQIEAAGIIRENTVYSRYRKQKYHQYINWEFPNQFLTSIQQKEEFEFLVSLRNQGNISKKAPIEANTKNKE